MVPRNEGACLWAPSVPFSTAPACTVNTTSSSFSCHLHTNGAFSLERSKSDVQAHKHLRTEYVKKTTFYTDDHKIHSEVKKEETSSSSFALERSKTAAQFTGSSKLPNPVDISIFDNRPAYSRAAPSPPVRTKLSPSNRRIEINCDVRTFTEQGKLLGATGILDETPIAPKRKLSPKTNNIEQNVGSSSQSHDSGEDLIKF